MAIVVVGLNHKATPVEVRERLAFGPTQLADRLRRHPSKRRRSTLEALTLAIVSKVLRQPIARLKAQGNGRGPNYARALRELFAVDEEV